MGLAEYSLPKPEADAVSRSSSCRENYKLLTLEKKEANTCLG